MTEPVALVPVEVSTRVELGVLRADGPAQLLHVATEAADALRGVIAAKKLFSTINGREYVRVEGWTTLATMMGCLPREVSVSRDEAGTYTATVELVRMGDQAVLTRASAECGMDEKTWAGRADYARRSMAVTRATSKACRIAFSWVMVLAGYQPTPAEEIPDDKPVRGQPSSVRSPSGRVAGTKDAASPPPTAQPLTERPAALSKPDEPMPQTGPGGGASWKGKPLTDYTSDELVRLKAWCLKANPSKFGPLTDAMDDVLASRGGE